MEDSKRIKRSVEEQKGSELLPGIPHDITLCVVIPNLSWRDLRTLFSVSPIWQQQIQTRQVYDIRRSTQSTEDLAVICHYYPGSKSKFGKRKKKKSEFGADHEEDIQVLSLYSVRDKCCYDLPAIPFPGGILIGSFCALDGKIYILGGRTPVGASREVYVLDEAGQQTEWKRCASMREPRLNFGVGVLNGKIYVFGGKARKPVLGCEVYDPKLNMWSPIAPMTEGRTYPKVAVVGEELFVYAGYPLLDNLLNAGVLDIYHPTKNQWRQMKSPGLSAGMSRDIFVARGKLHEMGDNAIRSYDSDKGLWNVEQLSAGIPSLGSSDSAQLTIAMGDELLVLKYHYEPQGFPTWVGTGVCLYQSTGFGEDTHIVWEKANCPPNTFGKLGFLSLGHAFLCNIQL